MNYYRLARLDSQTALWVWKTTLLTSLPAVLYWLRNYSPLPQDSIRVFTAPAKEELQAMLNQENAHLASGAVTAAQFLKERHFSIPEQMQSLAGAGGTGQASQPAAPFPIYSSLTRLWPTLDAAESSGSSALEQKRLELESGPGGDHDTPYHFTFPRFLPELLAWTRLHARVRDGEFQP